MKYHSKIYAKALCEAMAITKTSQEKEKAMKELLRIVLLNGDQSKLKEILVRVEEIILKKAGIKKIIVETARPLAKQNIMLIRSLVKPSDLLVEKIDSSLIAGIKITVNEDLQLDGSLSGKLNQIFNF